jgi:hypothetical protein
MIAPIVLWLGLAGKFHLPAENLSVGLTIDTGLSIAVFVTSCGLEVVDGGPANVPLYLNIVTAWYAVTAALQVLTTSMIAFKLLQHRRALNKHGLAASASGLGYISLASVLAESAVVYTIATIAYIPMIRLEAPVELWWGQVVDSLAVRVVRFITSFQRLTLRQFLNPAFIILLVVLGRSYTAASLSTPHSTLQFTTRSTAGQESTIFPTKTTVSRERDFEMKGRGDVPEPAM